MKEMMDETTIKEVADELQKYAVVPVASYSYEQLHAAIAAKINELITHNFSRLVAFLYQLDISEKKLKVLLGQSTNTPAGDIIATMIIERQLQKIEARKAFKTNGFSDEEKW